MGGAAVEKRVGDSVGIFASAIPRDNVSWTCSGVLLPGDIFMTNHHCGGVESDPGSYWTDEVLDNCLVDFSWDSGNTATQYGCGIVLAKDQRLDYSLIKLRPLLLGLPIDALPNPAQLTISSHNPRGVFIVHHALSMSKLVSDGCRAYDNVLPDNEQFYHNCDTQPGSSGAPVFDDNGSIIGLHHIGYKNVNGALQNMALWIDVVLSDACKQNGSHLSELWRGTTLSDICTR